MVELEARAYDVQMLKFGQVIDLELLDKMGAAKGAEELKTALAQQEAAHAAAMKDLDRQVWGGKNLPIDIWTDRVCVWWWWEGMCIGRGRLQAALLSSIPRRE